MSFIYSLRICSYCCVFLELLLLPHADGGSVTWYEPPPIVTTSNNLVELIADNIPLREGSTYQLSWNFSLTADLNLILVTLSLNDVNIATIVPSSGQAGLAAGFEGRFNVTWIPNRAILIILNVTGDDNGDFGCELTSFQGATPKNWVRKIPVQVIAKDLCPT
ncbi:uncharacterized protein LOC144662641 [Oculina patagonica]